jgi:hypothetical protein
VAGIILLRQQPNLMPFGKAFQRSTDRVADGLRSKRLGARKQLLRSRVGDFYWAKSGIPSSTKPGPEALDGNAFYESGHIVTSIAHSPRSYCRFIPLADPFAQRRKHVSPASSALLRAAGSHPTRLDCARAPLPERGQ